MNTDKLKEIRDKAKHNHVTMTGIKLYDEIVCEQIQSETYQLANKEWQSKFDALQVKYDLLVEDKLDAKQLGRDEVINEIRQWCDKNVKGQHYTDEFFYADEINRLLTSLKENK